MHSSMNHTDVQVGCLEVLGNYHKFKVVRKHLFPYFTENCNFPSQVPSLVRGRNFFCQDGTRATGCSIYALRIQGGQRLTFTL